MFSTAPLLGGSSTFADMKKCPPALLRAPGSLKYDASLCTANTISLLLYVNMASGCVATYSSSILINFIVNAVGAACIDAMELSATNNVESTARL